MLYSTVMLFLHCMLNIQRYEKIFWEIDETIASEPPCLLLIVELISLDTSAKATVGFSLKITSAS